MVPIGHCVCVMLKQNCAWITHFLCLLFPPTQKLQERQATLKKCAMSEKDKEKWGKVLRADVMSSEESDSADDVVIVKPLPWRSLKVQRFFNELDQAGIESKTMQAKRQRKQRVIGSIESERPMPSVTLPSWAYTSADTSSAGNTSTAHS